MTPARRRRLERERKIDAPLSWGWVIEGGLCYYAFPVKDTLLQDGKPSPEAKAVRVRIITNADYNYLVRLARRAK